MYEHDLKVTLAAVERAGRDHHLLAWGLPHSRRTWLLPLAKTITAAAVRIQVLSGRHARLLRRRIAAAEFKVKDGAESSRWAKDVHERVVRRSRRLGRGLGL